MATTRDYMRYLNEYVDIAPANSQEELQAAETLQQIMDAHGVDAHIQEFDAPAWGGLVYRIVMIVLFIGVFLAGIQGTPVALVGIVLTALCGALFLSRFLGTDLLGNLGPRMRSQNVIALHHASGPRVDKANRPIVVVAHYDTPRDNFLYLPQMASFRPLIGRFSPILVLVSSICGLIQLLFFLPETPRRVIWIIGILTALPLLVLGIASIYERFSPCTDGANDNKAGVAALLGVLATVRPESDAVDAIASDNSNVESLDGEQVEPEETVNNQDVDSIPVSTHEEIVGVRHGEEVLSELRILPATCTIVYTASNYVARPADVAMLPIQDDQENSSDASTTQTSMSELASRGASVVAGAAERGRALFGRLSSRLGRTNTEVETDNTSEPETSDGDAFNTAGTSQEASAEANNRQDVASAITFSTEGDPSDSEVSHRDDSGLGALGDVYETTVADRNSTATPRPAQVADQNWGRSDLAPQQTGGFARRAVLFDLPDPSGGSNDPFATNPSRVPVSPSPQQDVENETTAPLNTPTAPAPVQIPNDMPLLRPLDNNWKGGAASRRDFHVVGDDDYHEELREELRETALGMDNDALISHDIWFVAVGASAFGHAGMKAFLDEYRKRIRGAFVINLSCVGAGNRTILTQEGIDNPRRADRRMERLISTVAKDLHIDLEQRVFDWEETDATRAMRSSMRAMTIMGMNDAGLPALSRTPDDNAENVDPAAVTAVSELVCEVIRRS